jgi:hypothetical protein
LSVDANAYRYFKWTITKNQLNNTAGVQASEFNLKFNDSKLSNISTTVTSPDFSNSYPGEDPSSLVDGKTTTKCLSYTGGVTFIFDFHRNVRRTEYNTYSYTTANDNPGRNPSTFTLYGSLDNVDYYLLDSRVNIANQEIYVEISFNIPP